ncbi:retrograde protein of 51 kDa-like isoform X1 [Ostrea edulis]|uniref:retrograde protein of 51 kDa-like isoform X1 n=1 Tax=Ostrea edulis TaxID=37623 RepID=UPI00209485A7|nr:retrograde protein of 51 kDa-like isoform X1 [Ostrea edulis]
MSQDKVEFRRSVKTAPVISSRTTVIQRTPAGSGSVIANRSSMSRMSMGGPSYSAGTLAGLSHKGVNDVIQTRDREKKDMQGLNERFASYIEKVRFLEAQNKALLAEIDRLKKLKGFDVSEIKELYEQEIAESRNVIDELSKEKAKFDSTLVGLQDALDDEKRERLASEKECAELRNKLDRLNDQIGEYEGEISTLRGRIGGLEDEVSKLRATNKRLQDDIARLRADLDEETRKRIEAEIKAQAVEEDLTFRLNVADAEIKELQALIDRDKGTEMRDIWKGEMSKAVSELQKEYDNQINQIRMDCESRMESQLRELQAGVNRDNMEAVQAKEESRKLKSRLGDLGPRVAELEAENSKLRNQIIAMESEMSDMQREHDRENDKNAERIAGLEASLEDVIRELQVLQDAKLSLELEISCYRKLLETEENSLKNVVENSTGARSKGANQLADIVQKSSTSYSSYGSRYSSDDSSGQQYNATSLSSTSGGYGQADLKSSESTGKLTVHRSCRGNIAFSEAAPDGSQVGIENNTSGIKGKTVNLKGWKIRREIGNKTKCTYEFKNDLMLGPGQKIKLYSGGAADMKQSDSDIVCEFFTWHAGGGSYILSDENNSEKASLKMTITN